MRNLTILSKFKFRFVFLLALLALFWPVTLAFAHGSITKGDYQIEIGWKTEPALQDEPNALEVLVTNSKTGKPVSGLERTLQAEVTYGASTKTLKLEPEDGTPGGYKANVLPSQAGDYTFHVFGKIENSPVDVSMTSSPTTFSSVDSKSSVSFPGQEPSMQTLRAELQRARVIAIVGIVVGGIGLLFGLVALIMVFTRGKGISLE